MLFDHALVPVADALFDPLDVAADLTAGRGRPRAAGGPGRVGPVAENLLRPVELPVAQNDGDGLDRPAPVPQRAPQSSRWARPQAWRPEAVSWPGSA